MSENTYKMISRDREEKKMKKRQEIRMRKKMDFFRQKKNWRNMFLGVQEMGEEI
ncbi:MAG: hypothetical protein AB1498_05930 [bacterium]